MLGNSCLMDLKKALSLKLYFERSKREPSPNFGEMSVVSDENFFF